jgi:uncharacterized protein YjdB
VSADGLNLSEGLISGNSARQGGGAFVNDDKTLAMSGGARIENNSASDLGGGVYIMGNFNMNGGIVTGNSASGNGGGIAMFIGGKFTAGGSAVVRGNLKGTAANNVYLSVYDHILISTEKPPAAVMEIWVSTANNYFLDVIVKNVGTSELAKNFISDNPNFGVMEYYGDLAFGNKLPAVTGVTLDKNTLKLVTGDTAALTANVQPSDAYIKRVAWSTSDEAVAKVSLEGVVTALGVGTATVTAKTADGGFTASCAVTVLSEISVITVTSQPAPYTNVDEGSISGALSVTAEVTENEIISYQWYKGWAGVAIPGETGASFDIPTDLKAGSYNYACLLTAPNADPVWTDEAVVKVVKEIPIVWSLYGVRVDKNAITLEVGETEQLTGTPMPIDATYAILSWYTDNATVATVSEDGLVTAIKPGTANITVETGNFDKIYRRLCRYSPRLYSAYRSVHY